MFGDDKIFFKTTLSEEKLKYYNWYLLSQYQDLPYWNCDTEII